MKEYSEIRKIITETLGLKNLKDYENYAKSFQDITSPRIPTEEEIDLLNPDNINNTDFWRIVEEIFGTDAVSNCYFATPKSKDEANRQNINILYIDGFISQIDFHQRYYSNLNVLEIGPGYGVLKNYIHSRTNFNYFGADVYPKIEGVDKNNPNGLLSDETLNRKYEMVLSSNVFQHLSVNQRRAYYRDISKILQPRFPFMFNMWTLNNFNKPTLPDVKGGFWVKHYGQFTQVQSLNEVFDDLRLYFHIDSHTISSTNWTTFVVKLK